MATKLLGVTQIGSVERPSILAGDFPIKTLAMLAAVDILVGGVIGAYDDTTGAVLWSNTADGDDDPPNQVLAIALEDIPAGQVGTVLISGEVIGANCVVAAGQESAWDAYWRSFAGFHAARINNIYIRDARLAPNQ